MQKVRLDLSEMVASTKQFYIKADKELQQLSIKKDCKQGCTHCCKVSIHPTLVEIIGVVDYLNKKDDVEFETLKRNIFAYNKKFEKKDPDITKKQYIDIDKSELLSFFTARDKISDYCPFLINNACYIYEMRPLICRYYISESSDICKANVAMPDVFKNPRYTDLQGRKDKYIHRVDKLFLSYLYKEKIFPFNPLERNFIFSLNRAIYPEKGDYIILLPDAAIKLAIGR